MKQKLILFIKAPVPGKVKTRLVPPLTYVESASRYRSWAVDVYQKALQLQNTSVEVAYLPDPAIPTPEWLSSNGQKISYFVQEGRHLGERMSLAFEKAFRDLYDKVIVIGSDSPGLPTEYIQHGFDFLNRHDLVLGPTLDGGFYLIGLRKKWPQNLFDDVRWSASSVLKQTITNAVKLGLSHVLTPEYFDIDRPEDLQRLNAGTQIKKISVVIPIMNEKNTISRQIEMLRRSSEKVNTEIVVVDGQSSDGSDWPAKNNADIFIANSRANRGEQMSLGAQKSSGDILFFLHADTQVPENWQEILIKTFGGAHEPVSGAAFSLSFDSARWQYRVIEFFARLRNLVTGVPHGDQGLAVRRNAYLSAGGYSNVPLMEEYYFIPNLRKIGKFVTLNETVKTSARKYELVGPFINAIKNSVFLCLFFAGVPPEQLARWYRKGDGHG